LDKTLSAALSHLHRSVLKPQGFLKKAGTFSRAHAEYTELFNIQASNWNGPWGKCFYVNCGLKFSDLPFETSWLYFPGTQWACRIQSLVKGLSDQWHYDESSVNSVVDQLGTAISDASGELSRNLGKFRSEYLVRLERLQSNMRVAKA
jgi:hypothetical protein